MNNFDFYVVAVECSQGTTIMPSEDGKVTIEDAQARADWLKEMGYAPRIGRVVFD
jgi:hypothetical protein